MGRNGALFPASCSGAGRRFCKGIRHERRPELAKRRISGTWEPANTMLTEKLQVETPRGREYGCVMAGTGQRVLAMKSPIKGWSQGAVSRSLIRRANQQWEEPDE
jgi:hypothetical protein